MAFLVKQREEILQQILSRLQSNTPISATSPGSVARAIAEAVSTELADLYSILDFNLSVSVLSSAQGRALDLMGSLFNVQRKTLTSLAATGTTIGSFYFYMDTPNPEQFVIPKGTQVTTGTNTVLGRTFVYRTMDDVIFPAGRTRAFAVLRPAFADSVYTAGENTLVYNDFVPSNPSIVVRCTNPKVIPAQVGYESDEAYRVRILNAIRTAAGGTELSCRMAALAVNGVRDIGIRSSAFGLGSFEVLVVFENPDTKTAAMVAVRDALEKVRPVGVRLFLREPDSVILDFGASLVVRKSNFNLETLARRAETAVLRYLNELSVGTPLVYNQLIQAIMDSTPEAVLDVVVNRFSMNGEQVLRKNFSPLATEQILPGFISVTIAQ